MNSQSPTYYEKQITAVENHCDVIAQQLDCMRSMCDAKHGYPCPPDGEIISRRSVIVKNASTQYSLKCFDETNSGCSNRGTNVTKANNDSCIYSKSQVTVTESEMSSTGEKETLNMKCAGSKFKKVTLTPTSRRSTANEKLSMCQEINSKDRNVSKIVQKNKERNNSSKQVSIIQNHSVRPHRPLMCIYKKRHKQEKHLTKLHGPFKGSSASLKVLVNKGKSDNTKKAPIMKRSRKNIVSNKGKVIIIQEKNSIKNQNKVVKHSYRKAGKYAITENAAKKIIPLEKMAKGKMRKNSGKMQTSGMQDSKGKPSYENKTTCLPKFNTRKSNMSYQNITGKNSQMNTVKTMMQKSFVNTQRPIFNRNISNNVAFNGNAHPRKFTERVRSSNCANKGVNKLKNSLQKQKGLIFKDSKLSQMHQRIMPSNISEYLNNRAEGYSPYNSQPNSARRTFPRHLNQSVYPNMHFVVAKSTTPSHNLGINVQTALSLINTKRNSGQQAVNNPHRYCHENGKGDCGGLQRQVLRYKTILSQVLTGEEQPSFNTNESYICQQSPALQNIDHCLISSPECVDQHREFALKSTEDGVEISPTEHDSNIMYVLKRLYDEFKNLIKKQKQLKQTISSDSKDGMEELEELESKIQAKEDEVNVILYLHREASLRQQAVAAASTTPAYLHNDPSRPPTAATTNTTRLTKVLRAVQRFQEHLKSNDNILLS